MLEFNPGIDIYIASRDRPFETNRAIQALKAVDFGVKTRIIVSDNASSPSSVLTDLPEGVIHLVRQPCGAQEHFNLVIGELNCEWFLFTHDDDEMLPALGKLFRESILIPEVNVISGRSQITNKDGVAIIDHIYEDRLEKAGMLTQESKSIYNFLELLFDYGTLFPASAIILKSALISHKFALNPDTHYAGDLEYSLEVARHSVVRYQGIEPVMKYHLHGGNSVFDSNLPFVMPSQTLICRIQEMIKNPDLINELRISRLKNDYRRAALLAFEAGETKQLEILMKYVAEFHSTFNICLAGRFFHFLVRFQSVLFIPRLILEFRRKFLVNHSNVGY
jgi:hypothetical protein